jgi:serine/threonine-protein kinase RsbW
MVDSRGALAQDGRRAERLELRVPTTATQLPAVRAMAGDLAIRMDYDLDAVEDLRLAVDEACATLTQIATGDEPLTVIFETTRAGLHIEAWVPTAEGAEVPRDGFGWAILATLVDAVDARRSTQAEVPGGDGSRTPVGLIAMDKYLPGQRPPGMGEDAGHDLSVAR